MLKYLNLCREVIYIYSKFLSLKPEKQARILNAAMGEFARKGYDNASTNQIVKEAEISKGILFHYFRNKKELFLFLYDFATDTLLKDYYGKLDTSDRDIFRRIKQISRYKLDIMDRFPEMFKFLMAAHFEGSEEIRHDLYQRNDKLLMETYAKTYDNIDLTLFKDGVDVQKAIEIISWSIEGYALREQEKVKQNVNSRQDMERMMAGIDPYLDILKLCFYK